MTRKKVFVLIFIFVSILIPIAGWAECRADINCDGDVDAQDLSILASEYGKSDCGTTSLTINPDDYQVPVGLVKNFGVKKYLKEDPWVSESSFTIGNYEDYSTWEDPSGIYKYYSDREEHYENNILVGTCYYNTSHLFSTPSEPKRVGESWGGSYIRQCDYSESSQVRLRLYTLIGIEDVTVPAGTFKNCLKVFGNRGPDATSMIIWIAPGIGWVKRHYEHRSMYDYDNGRVYELTSYSIDNP